jgi:hypothetical protein
MQTWLKGYVHVDLQVPPWQNLVEASVHQGGVGHQPSYSRYVFEEGQKVTAHQLAEHLSGKWSVELSAVALKFLLSWVVVKLPFWVVGIRKLGV